MDDCVVAVVVVVGFVLRAVGAGGFRAVGEGLPCIDVVGLGKAVVDDFLDSNALSFLFRSIIVDVL